ncbi:MAG TPA: hypothetical protein VFV53_07925 [Candidatus Limnocylindrales bacterium]|nr:hypothetical protein [Candidatus Limnocylindrales bacterium]
MADMAHGTGTEPRDRIVLAVILIVVGVVGLVSQLFELSTNMGGVIVTVIGLGLLGAFSYTRQYGYLIPGGIMTGLGVGIIVSESVTFVDDKTASGAIVLGLGVGFLAIWVIGGVMRIAQNHWWPIIPGGILAVVGGALLIGDQAVWLLDYWGVAIIAVGLFVLWRGFVEGRTRN